MLILMKDKQDKSLKFTFCVKTNLFTTNLQTNFTIHQPRFFIYFSFIKCNINHSRTNLDKPFQNYNKKWYLCTKGNQLALFQKYRKYDRWRCFLNVAIFFFSLYFCLYKKQKVNMKWRKKLVFNFYVNFY